MRNVLTLLYLSFVMLVASSCGCHRYLHPETMKHRDSVSVTYRDSVVYRIDTIYVDLPDQHSSSIVPVSEQSHLETDVAYSDAYVDSLGRLHHSLGNKPEKLALPVPIPERTISVDRANTSSDSITVTRYINKPLTWWQQSWIRIGKISSVLLLVILLVSILRKKILL